MQIFYWCPFLTHIATINAVKNSATSLKRYKKDISELSGTDENDTIGLYNQMIVDNKVHKENYIFL